MNSVVVQNGLAQRSVASRAVPFLSSKKFAQSTLRKQLNVKQLRSPSQNLVPIKAAADVPAPAEEPNDPFEKAFSKIVGPAKAATAVTGLFIVWWYGLNVGFNLLNKSIYKYFPFPWTVSCVHVTVGAVYCGLTQLIAPEASFKRSLSGDEFKSIVGPASMHALGHIAANVSFAAVAISLSHTVKTLEPAFNVVLSRLILGEATPLPVLATLVPIAGGVALASAAELSFNWLGFLSAMASNLTFGFRAVWSKIVMKNVKNLGSTALYAYTTLISVVVCAPLALYMEGAGLQAGIDKAILEVGKTQFYSSLIGVGLLYHLYNQFAFNTLERVSPVSHGVCNVIKRVVIIIVSVIFFGTKLTTNTKIGTVVALIGTYLYTRARQQAAVKKSA